MGTDKQKDTVNIYVAYVIVVTNFNLCHVLNSSDSDTDFLTQIKHLLCSRNGAPNISVCKLHSSGNFLKKNPRVRMQ